VSPSPTRVTGRQTTPAPTNNGGVENRGAMSDTCCNGQTRPRRTVYRNSKMHGPTAERLSRLHRGSLEVHSSDVSEAIKMSFPLAASARNRSTRMFRRRYFFQGYANLGRGGCSAITTKHRTNIESTCRFASMLERLDRSEHLQPPLPGSLSIVESIPA